MPKQTKRRGQVNAVAGKKNTWVVRVPIAYDPSTGKRAYHNKTIHGTRKDAERYLTDVFAKVDQGSYSEPSQMTVNELLDAWLRTKKLNRRANTCDAYEEKARNYIRPAIGSCRIDRLQNKQFYEIYNDMREAGKSARTIRYVHITISAALKYAVENHYIPINVANSLEVPTGVRYAGKALTADEARHFMDVALDNGRWGLTLAFALASGMRPSEYLALRWRDIDLKKGTASVCQTTTFGKGQWRFEAPKTAAARRTITLPISLLPLLLARRKQFILEKLAAGDAWHDLDLVFCTEKGSLINRTNFHHRYYKRVAKAANVPTGFRLYDLRHTCASLLLLAGVNAKIVSERLGHSDVAFTLKTYAHFLPTMQVEAADRLNTSLFENRTSAN
jgi:integrase